MWLKEASILSESGTCHPMGAPVNAIHFERSQYLSEETLSNGENGVEIIVANLSSNLTQPPSQLFGISYKLVLAVSPLFVEVLQMHIGR